MRTTNKQFKEQVQAHIIESLSTDSTEVLKEQLENVVSEFKNWYSPYEQKRTPNRQTALIDFLLGLPSCLSVEYEYYTISQTLKQWFEACGETYREQDSDKEANLYYHLLTREFYTLCKREGVTF